VAALPVRVVEADGPYLPLGKDELMAVYVAEKAAEEAGALLTLPNWYCHVMDKFPGIISISQNELGPKEMRLRRRRGAG